MTTDARRSTGRPLSIEGIGGGLFDELVAAWIAAQLGGDAASALAWSDAPDWAEAAVALGAAARQAKEELSEVTATEILVAHPDGQHRLPIQRQDLEDLIRRPAGRAVELLRRAVINAGLGPADLSAVHLAGGGSAIPLVSQLVAQAFGDVPVIRHPDGGGALAAGAALVGSWPSAAVGWPPTPPAARTARGAAARGGPGPEAGPGAGAPGRPGWPEPAPTTGWNAQRSTQRPMGRSRRRLGVVAVAVVAAGGIAAGVVVATTGGGRGGPPSPRPPLTQAQLSQAALTGAEVGQGYTSKVGVGAGCGSPPTPLANVYVVLSNPGLGEITNQVFSYATVAEATTAAGDLQAAESGCLGAAASLRPLTPAPAVCQSTWVAAGTVATNGNAVQNATGYAGVYRCGRAVGELRAYPEQSLAFTEAGFNQLFDLAGSNLEKLNP